MKLPHSLRSLAHPNLRLFFAGQSISLVGSWMQSVAMSWLVYRLTGSAEMLGLVTFLSQVPVFILGPWAGSLADQFPRKRIVQLTQVNAFVQATILATLTFTDTVRPGHLLILAVMLGLSHAFEIPARHALLAEMAGSDAPNAVALNSTIVNSARVVGPSLAGVVVAAFGEKWCFLLNALSFAGVLVALHRMQVPDGAPSQGRGWTHLLEGFEYSKKTALVRAVLLLTLLSSFFALPYQALLPLFAAEVFDGGAALLGTLLTSAGLGSLLGAILLLRRPHLGGLARWVGGGALLLGTGLLGLSLVDSPLVARGFLAMTGFGFIVQFAGSITLIHGLVPAGMRGRVLGLFSMLFTGITPFGALAGGWLAARFGAPLTVGIGAACVLAGGLAFHALLPSVRRRVPAQHPELAQVP